MTLENIARTLLAPWKDRNTATGIGICNMSEMIMTDSGSWTAVAASIHWCDFSCTSDFPRRRVYSTVSGFWEPRLKISTFGARTTTWKLGFWFRRRSRCLMSETIEIFFNACLSARKSWKPWGAFARHTGSPRWLVLENTCARQLQSCRHGAGFFRFFVAWTRRNKNV